jgi:N-acyl-D-aspartate/D-glutamate deacylase
VHRPGPRRRTGAASLTPTAPRLWSRTDSVSRALSGRGVLREGGYADIVVSGPATAADRATFGDPHQLSAGVSEVLVNGKVTISGGAFTGELAGRALAGPGARR